MTAEQLTNHNPYYAAQAAGNLVLRGETAPTDPFDVMRAASARMFDEYPALQGPEKAARLDQFFRDIEAHDRAAYPDMNGAVEQGVPDGYIPDGFVDLGPVKSLIPSERFERTMNYVDTYRTLHQHKALFEFVFDNINPKDFAGMPNGELAYQQTIIANIAEEISATMPYGEPTPREVGGIVPMSEATPAVCQQHGLVSQVLMQAFGIRSRISKNFLATNQDIQLDGIDRAGDSHVSNVVGMHDGVEGREYMFDSTNPQLDKNGDKTFGFFRLNDQNRNANGAWIVTEAQGGHRTYLEHSNMNWTVMRQS